MADYTLTAANVLASAQATILSYTAGATLTAGQVVYQDTADLDATGRGKVKLADANGASAAVQTALGITLNGAAANQPVRVALADPDFTHGLATVAAGDVIVLSATPGALAPAADLASGHRANVLLVANSATKGVLRISTAAAVKP